MPATFSILCILCVRSPTVLNKLLEVMVEEILLNENITEDFVLWNRG